MRRIFTVLSQDIFCSEFRTFCCSISRPQHALMYNKLGTCKYSPFQHWTNFVKLDRANLALLRRVLERPSSHLPRLLPRLHIMPPDQCFLIWHQDANDVCWQKRRFYISCQSHLKQLCLCWWSCCVRKLLKPDGYFGLPCTFHSLPLLLNRMKTFYRQCKARDKVSLKQTRREVESELCFI